MVSKKHMLCALVAVGGAGMLYYTQIIGEVKRSRDINSTEGGAPIIIRAVEAGRIDKVKQFMDYPGINIEQPDWVGNTAFTIAAALGRKEIFDLLLPKANILHADNNGQTALMGATKGGHTEIVQALLNDSRITPEYINAKDGTGKTALTYAKEKGKTAIADLLKSKGATEATE